VAYHSGYKAVPAGYHAFLLKVFAYSIQEQLRIKVQVPPGFIKAFLQVYIAAFPDAVAAVKLAESDQ
jgi:hypothetical protein